MTQEVLKLALEAFEWNYNTDLDNIPACEKWAKMLKENITAIKEALAHPEQEPTAWEQFYPDIGKPQIAFNSEVIEYVAPQRTWVGLTLDDIPDDDTNNLDFYRGGRWAERVLKEKNNG